MSKKQYYQDISSYVNEITEYQKLGRETIHLTLTYNKIDESRNPELMNRIFSKWWLSRFLPFLLNTRYYTKPKISVFQPYSRVFLHNHFSDKNTAYLHHHAYLCCHKETMSRLSSVLNTVLTKKDNHQLSDFQQIQSVKLTCRDEWIATYTAKNYDKYGEYVLQFGG